MLLLDLVVYGLDTVLLRFGGLVWLFVFQECLVSWLLSVLVFVMGVFGCVSVFVVVCLLDVWFGLIFCDF